MTTMTAAACELHDAANLRSICRCQCCRDMLPRSAMSVYDGICNDCLDRSYLICDFCGQPVSQPYAYDFTLARRTHGHARDDVWVSGGRPCCYTCYNDTRRSDRWRPTPLDVSIATYDKVGSTRKFGVEIETSYCHHCNDLKGITKFGAKSDPTVSGLEFDSPILYGDEGFEVIRDLLVFADRNNWEADNDCGCHAHFDMRDESDDQLWATYYAYNRFYPMWAAAVSPRRREGTYCRKPCCTPSDISVNADHGGGFKDYASDAERYDYLNAVAYYDHNTFEVRLLEGTLDAATVCNWVALHARFIDRVHNMSFDAIDALGSTRSKQFKSLVKLIDDAPLTDWLAHRARRTGCMPLRGRNCAS